MMIKRLRLPSWDMIIRFFGYGAIIAALTLVVGHVDTFAEFILFVMAIALSVYIVTEISNQFITQNVVIDFRTEDQIQEDNHKERLEMLEGVKNKLMMQLAQGQISLDDAQQRANAAAQFVAEANDHKVLDFMDDKKYLEDGQNLTI